MCLFVRTLASACACAVVTISFVSVCVSACIYQWFNENLGAEHGHSILTRIYYEVSVFVCVFVVDLVLLPVSQLYTRACTLI